MKRYYIVRIGTRCLIDRYNDGQNALQFICRENAHGPTYKYCLFRMQISFGLVDAGKWV